MDGPEQRELPLPFPELSKDLPLLPARMVNEYEYCPRLAYLEWVQGEWADSGDTEEGRHVHRRVDKPGDEMPAARHGAFISERFRCLQLLSLMRSNAFKRYADRSAIRSYRN